MEQHPDYGLRCRSWDACQRRRIATSNAENPREGDQRFKANKAGMTMKAYSPTAIKILATDDTVLLVIDLANKTVTGELKNVNEAAKQFVKFIEQHLLGVGAHTDPHHYLPIPKRVDGVQIPTQFVCHTCGNPAYSCTGCGYET